MVSRNDHSRRVAELLAQAAASGTIECVEIRAGGDACPACRRLDGRLYHLADAIDRQPIPCDVCCWAGEAVADRWCCCQYLLHSEPPPPRAIQ